jgi:hypothetical protein
MKLIIHGLEEMPSHHEPCPAKAPYFPRSRKDMVRNSTMLNREMRQNGQGSPWPTDALRALSEMATPPAKDVERSSGRGSRDRAVVRNHMARHSWLGGYVRIESYGRSVRPILTITHRFHLLAVG